ncbi:MAG: NifU family protein [Planctomycetes bacterium]|nr:NifU family protein [Planctomycetota bacterium]
MTLSNEPNSVSSGVVWREKMREEVEKVIEKLRPALGVNAVELVDVQDGIVHIRVFSSACHAGIPEGIIVTLLEEELIDEIPEISRVIAV